MLVDVGRKILQEGEDGGAATAAEGHGRHDEQPGQEGVRALHEVELGVVDREVGRGFVGPLLHSDGILARESQLGFILKKLSHYHEWNLLLDQCCNSFKI